MSRTLPCPTSRARRVPLLVLACVLLVALAVPVERASAAGAPEPLTFLQLNACGADCGGSSTARADELADAVLAGRPAAVGVNEACAADLARVMTRLRDGGYPMYLSFRASIPGGRSGCAGSDYGNAVLTRAQPNKVDLLTFTAQAGGVDRRGVVCARVLVGSTTLWVCSTHLLPGNAGLAVRDAQVGEVVQFVARYSARVGLLGDLNEWPGGKPMNRVYSPQHGGGATGTWTDMASYTAAGVACRCGAATAGTAKIDYVLFQTARWARGTSRVATAQTSDHRFLWATAALR